MGRRAHGGPGTGHLALTVARAAAALARVALALTLVAVATAALAAERRATPAPSLRVTAATGGLSLSDSLHGSALLSATRMRPGSVTRGEVTIANSGGSPGTLTLRPAGRSDSPGPGGGRISGILDLTVTETTGGANGVYSGKLGAMQAVPLGSIGAGASRSFRFAATLPDQSASAGGDDRYAGSSASLRFDWTAVAVAPRLALRLRRAPTQRLGNRAQVNVQLSCTIACRVTVTGAVVERRATTARARYLVRVKRVRASLPAGRYRALRIRLTPAQARRAAQALARHSRVQLVLGIHATAADGGRATKRTSIALRR
jgi:hypothetical protein